ncbi:MAG: YicC family protein [Magnetococcales bacterium]|nr:YicC family protein [Magnetococcales bacterium]
MPRSMTGFARAERVFGDCRIAWQIKSVNHRYLDLAIRTPEAFGEMESLAAKRLKSLFFRGRLECTLTISACGGQKRALTLDEGMLKALLSIEKRLISEAGKNHKQNTLTLDRLISWPGMVREAPLPKLNEIEWGYLEREVLLTLEEAAHKVGVVREGEGEELVELIGGFLDQCQELLQQVAQRLPLVQKGMEERLRGRVAEMSDLPVDENRLLQEVAFFLNRMEISEEVDRLGIHLTEIRSMLGEKEAVGRRLDFLCQELNREANTLCSKSQDGELSRLGVELKSEVEKIREQVQNLE